MARRKKTLTGSASSSVMFVNIANIRHTLAASAIFAALLRKINSGQKPGSGEQGNDLKACLPLSGFYIKMPFKRVALYVRVSTAEQDTRRQEDDLREASDRAGNEEVIAVFSDMMSGGVIRPGFQEMMQAARQHKFDKLRVWSLDRFSREGVLKTLTHLKRLADLGIEFSSLAEPILDTSDEMTRDIVLSVIASLAQAFRVRLSENTKSGLRRAEKTGKKLGRPKGKKDSIPRTKAGYYVGWQETKRKGKKRRGKGIKKGTVKKEEKELDFNEGAAESKPE